VRELELIEALEQLLSSGDPRIIRGIGDDGAVVRARRYSVTSVDAMVDGVHFLASELSPAEIGHRALAGALSDLAAMAAEPGEAYLALGLTPHRGREFALELVRGARALAERHGVTIAGGDVTRSDALFVSFTVVGWSDDPARLVGRDGAVSRTIATAGRTVVFSAFTVAAAMASLLVFPQRFLFSMGIGGVPEMSADVMKLANCVLTRFLE